MMASKGYPVVDGDSGADLYGHAATSDEAVALCSEVFVDGVHHAELIHGRILMADGSVMYGPAWCCISGGDYWYHRRAELRPGMIFETNEGRVMLDRGVPGDGTKWYVASWAYNGGWSYEDATIEPGDLRGEPLAS